jgi:membrane protein DedA with SNARE-associated domain
MQIPFGQLLSDYGYWAVFIGCLLEGETILVLAGFAAHQGYLSLPVTLAIAFVGGTLGDQLFFWLGRFWGKPVLTRLPRSAPRVQRMHELLDRHHPPIIVGIRFMYGLRLIGPIVIGTCKVSGWRFTMFNVIGAAIWAPLIGGLGYLFGSALQWLLDSLKEFELAALGFVVVVALLTAGVRWWRARGAE